MKRSDRSFGAALAALLSAGCVSSAAGHVPLGAPSAALPPAVGSLLAQTFGLPTQGAPSWFAPIDRGDDGLDARLALAFTAEASLDVQSYLWHEDPCGSLLLDRLLDAADRGVRVRLLIDGFKLEGHEELDEALELHPHLEVPVFNPTLHRAGLLEGLELVEHLGQLDHRMHNKLFHLQLRNCQLGTPIRRQSVLCRDNLVKRYGRLWIIRA